MGRSAARTSDSAQVWAEHVPARGPAVRALVIPGLRDSGEAPWQTWLQAQYRDAVRYSAQTHWVAALIDVVHINTESGFGPWPLARHKVDQIIRRHLGLQSCLCQVADDSHVS